jgi:hypothetical protein
MLLHRLVSDLDPPIFTSSVAEIIDVSHHAQSSLVLFLLFIFIIVLGVHCGIYKSSYNIPNTLEFTPSIILYSPPLIPGIVSTGLIFPFTYMSTQNLYHIHPPIPFPYILLPPTGTIPTPAVRTCSSLFYL